MSILNKPPYRYDNKRKAVLNDNNVVVLTLTGYSWLTDHASIPPVHAGKEEDIFGELVKTMLNAKDITKSFFEDQ